MHKVKELKIWHKAMNITTELYDITKSFPKEEVYGITSQMKRAAVSIPSNIAEGAGRRSELEFRNFLNISNGSSYELDTQLLIICTTRISLPNKPLKHLLKGNR
jgi:four helix bundle protein